MIEPTETETRETLDAFAEARRGDPARGRRGPVIARNAPYDDAGAPARRGRRRQAAGHPPAYVDGRHRSPGGTPPRADLHPDKVLFPDDGITKLDLANYYAAVAPAMVEHVRDRPLNLWRWNNGIAEDVVVQQAIPKGAPEWVRRVTVSRRKGGEITKVVGGEAATLVWLANQNCITPHNWTARHDRPDHPDRIVFDFDPPTTRATCSRTSARAPSRSATCCAATA